MCSRWLAQQLLARRAGIVHCGAEFAWGFGCVHVFVHVDISACHGSTVAYSIMYALRVCGAECQLGRGMLCGTLFCCLDAMLVSCRAALDIASAVVVSLMFLFC
jgi:hypothetical protein